MIITGTRAIIQGSQWGIGGHAGKICGGQDQSRIIPIDIQIIGPRRIHCQRRTVNQSVGVSAGIAQATTAVGNAVIHQSELIGAIRRNQGGWIVAGYCRSRWMTCPPHPQGWSSCYWHRIKMGALTVSVTHHREEIATGVTQCVCVAVIIHYRGQHIGTIRRCVKEPGGVAVWVNMAGQEKVQHRISVLIVPSDTRNRKCLGNHLHEPILSHYCHYPGWDCNASGQVLLPFTGCNNKRVS